MEGNSNSLALDNARQINELHAKIERQTRMIVEDAISIGSLLDEVRSTLEYGKFGEWIERNTTLSSKTAYRYLKVFEYKEITSSAVTLQDAYRIAESAESEEKRKREQAAVEIDNLNTPPEPLEEEETPPEPMISLDGVSSTEDVIKRLHISVMFIISRFPIPEQAMIAGGLVEKLEPIITRTI